VTTDRTILQERLVSIVRRFPQRRILVIGDAIADQFVYGGISRVSREAPVFIIRHEHTETVPGGAANCATNLASLGANVSLVSVAGNDEAGRALVDRLRSANVNCDGIISTDGIRTTTKVRILAAQSHSTRQQVVRIDYEAEPISDSELSAKLRERLLLQAHDRDAIIISDYNYGVLNSELIDAVRAASSTRKIPVLVDSRFRLMSFPGFTSATPNEAEVEQLGVRAGTLEELSAAGEQMRRSLGYRALLITRGGNGMVLFEDGVEPLSLNAIGSHEPVDVTGAGDTVIATYTLALSSDSSFPDAARLANYAGGLVVMKRGTASITAGELENSVLHSDLKP
jgi:D-glycero-beta-D-manno-heptose-7-phosphate kinase